MSSPVVKAKSECLDDFRRAWMKANGTKTITVDIINSAEYVKALKLYWQIFVPLALERMRREAVGE